MSPPVANRADTRGNPALGKGALNAFGGSQKRYSIRTTTLSAIPRASITVRRAKPGPSGMKNSVRRPASEVRGKPREGIEQDRRCGAAPDQPRHRSAVGAADPHTDGAASVEPDRPRVAIAVACAGLECDAPAHRVLRRGGADQHVADVPSGDRI